MHPSYVYLVISSIALIVMLYQNIGNVNTYCLGSYTCSVSKTALIFIIKASLYFILDMGFKSFMCKANATNIAWLVLLLPVIIMFVLIAAMMVSEL